MISEMLPVPIQIRFADIDAARHVHNAVYLHWFELARIALFRSFLPADHDWSREGLIIARNEIDHKAPVYFSDRIEVDAWCSRIGHKSIELRYAVIRKDLSDVIVAQGGSVLVCFDHKNGHSIPVPENWRSELQELQRPS